jgi:hypothetical protein
MRRSQGRYFSPKEINTIKFLLSSTDLSLQDIAVRMDCAKSSIVTINQNFQIREYRGRRRYWVCAMSKDTSDATEQQTHTMSGSPS